MKKTVELIGLMTMGNFLLFVVLIELEQLKLAQASFCLGLMFIILLMINFFKLFWLQKKPIILEDSKSITQ